MLNDAAKKVLLVVIMTFHFTQALLISRKANITLRNLKFRFASKVRSKDNYKAAPNFSNELNSKYFEFQRLETDIYEWWEKSNYFTPKASSTKKPFVIPMPPPNVTGYLHMGHAIFVALQDIMARFHRMRGRPTLWLPGT